MNFSRQKSKFLAAEKFAFLPASSDWWLGNPAVREFYVSRRDADEPLVVLHAFSLLHVWRGRTRPQAGCGRPAAVPGHPLETIFKRFLQGFP